MAQNRSSLSLRAIPTWQLWCNRQYNRLATAVCTGNSTADHPVGMAYLLGNWATGRRATGLLPTSIKHV